MTTTTSKTPCEEKGYKVGDKFIALEGNGIMGAGATLELYYDDGTNIPQFYVDALEDHRYLPLATVIPAGFGLTASLSPAPSTFNPLTARDRIKEIDELTESLSVEREALLAQLASEGFLLVSETMKGQEPTGEEPSEDMTDPKNWQVGDLVESLADEHDTYAGEAYRVVGITLSLVYIRDSIGEEYPLHFEQVKWHSRPKD